MEQPPHWDDLSNLPETLKRIRAHAENIVMTSSPTQTSDDEGLISYHLKEMAFLHVRGQLDVVLENLRMAALYLAYILKGKGSTEALPDLSNNKKEILAAWAEHLPQLSSEEEYRVKQFAKTKPGQMRLPLHLALNVSPLYLLVAISLTRHHAIGREHLLKVSTKYIRHSLP